MELQPTGAGDFGVLRALFDDPSFLDWGGPGRLSDQRIGEKYLGKRAPAVECFIVQADEEPVGLAIIHTEPDGGGIDLVLLAEARGRGIGREVVRRLVELARVERAWLRITVDPDSANEQGIRFWRAVGFAPERVIRDSPDRQPYLIMLLTDEVPRSAG